MATSLNITNIPAPRVPFIDERTGLMSREWYRFFLNLFILTGSGSNPTTLDELQIGPPNQPDFTELLIQINKDIAPQYEDQSGDFLKTLDTAQLMSMMSRFENAEAAIQGAYLQPPQLPAVTSVAALTLGTTGTDLSSTVANGTTTPVITLQVPTASAVNRGALSAADWTTFNSKGSGSVTSVAQSFTGGLISVSGSPITTSGTLALTVAGTSGGVPYFSSASTWATSAALAASSLVLGGGAGAAPATTTTGTGVVTALGVNTGTAGAFVVNDGALGTPSSGTVTNLTGTASININGTVGATTPAAGTFTSISDSGNLTFTGTGNRITGDFSNATGTNRVAFQSSTTNGNTVVGLIPNGTSTQSQAIVYNNSDIANANGTQILVSATESRLQATNSGTAGLLPMTFYAGGSERVRITTAGRVGIGTGATVNYALEVSTDSAGKPGVGGLWTVVSDERIKSDIAPANLDRCYEIVKSVPLKYFGFAPGVYNADQIQDNHNLGWIAQDVQKVFKNAVSVKPFTPATGDVIEDCLDLNSGQIIAALYGAVQSLMEKIETLTERVAVLEAK